VADSKHHTAIKKHLAKAKAAHKEAGDSMDKIAEILGALQGAQPPAQQPTAPGMTAGAVSPMGGVASR